MEIPTPPRSGNHIPSIDHAITYKASTPIKIPTRSRPVLSPTFSPVNRPLSPDLIFDMSPVNLSSDSFLSSDLNSRYSPFVHRTLKSKTASASTSKSPPFMYPFPRPSTHYLHAKDHFAPRQSPKSSSSPLFCSSKKLVTDRQTQTPLQRHCLTSAFEDDFENSPDSHTKCVFTDRGRSRRLNVSDRFSALASPASIQSRDRMLVSQPPFPTPSRSKTYESCLEGAPSAESASAMEALMDANVNPFEIGFRRHLMKRTEQEQRVAVGRTRAVASMKVSVQP